MFSPKQLAVMRVLIRHGGWMSQEDLQKEVLGELDRSDLFPCIKFLVRGGHVLERTGRRTNLVRITKLGRSDFEQQEPRIFPLTPEVV